MRNGLAGRLNFGSGLVEFGYHGVQRAGHVGSGIAIGHWVDIQAINARSVDLDRISEGNHRTTKPIGIEMIGRALGAENRRVHLTDGSGQGAG